MNVWDISMDADGPVTLPVTEGHSTALLVLRGHASFDSEQQAQQGELAIFSHTGDSIQWQATAASRYLLLSGQTIDEPIVGSGPFVMNTQAEIRQAHEEFQNGTLGRMEN